MNTRSKGDIQKQFAAKFREDVPNDGHFAKMLSYRFLSEIEKITDERNISRKDLALKINVSPSYITQLYRGSKNLNLETIAKLEAALGMRFEIRAVSPQSLEDKHTGAEKKHETKIISTTQSLEKKTGKKLPVRKNEIAA